MIWLTMICVTCAVICLISWHRLLRLHREFVRVARTLLREARTENVQPVHSPMIDIRVPKKVKR